MGKLESILAKVRLPLRERINAIDQYLSRVLSDQAISIGSTARHTYVPDERGGCNDVDLYVLDRQATPLDELKQEIEAKRDDIERKIKETYNTPVTLKVYEEHDKAPKITQTTKGPRTTDFKQLRYEAIDPQGNRVFDVDFNFLREHPDGAALYNSYFEPRINQMVSRLAPKDQEIGKEMIKANIRGFKVVLKEHDAYKASQGGLGGIATEILMLNLFDTYGAPNSLDELESCYSVGTMLKHINDQGENLSIVHPTSDMELTQKKTPQARAELMDKLATPAREWREYLPEIHYAA